MSTLREELVSKVMNQWNGVDMDRTITKRTFGEQVFDWVKDHPYSCVEEIERGLGVDKTASISTYLKSMLDRGILGRTQKTRMPYPGYGARNHYVYYGTSDVYKPSSGTVKRPKKTARPVRTEHDTNVKPYLRGFNPEMFVQDLSLKDARAVYEVLKGYFG